MGCRGNSIAHSVGNRVDDSTTKPSSGRKVDFAKQKTEGESGINGYRSLYSEHYPSFAGEGVKRVIFFCAALSLTRLRRELSPGESLGLSVLFVWCVPVGFVGVACQGQSLRQPSAATSLYTREAWLGVRSFGG